MRLTVDSQEWLAADAIGDPSLLSDGLTHRDRIALDIHRDARAAMALSREAVEDSAPPGSVAREDYSIPEFTVQAEALVRGIYAIAGRKMWKGILAKIRPEAKPEPLPPLKHITSRRERGDIGDGEGQLAHLRRSGPRLPLVSA